MIMTKVKLLLIGISLLGLSTCKQELSSESIATNFNLINSLEASISSLTGLMDEQSNEDTQLLSSCNGRASRQTCTGGLKSIAYSDCTLGETSQKLAGNVDLTYSQGECTLNQTGDTLVRTFDMIKQQPFNELLEYRSHTHQNFLAETLSGGEKITKTDEGWKLEILGKQKIRRNALGKIILDISLKSSTPHMISQNLSRQGRILNGGELVVFQNIAEYKMVLKPQNLEFKQGCCYPIGGQIDVSISGSLKTRAKVTFGECSKAFVEKDKKTLPLELVTCEN